MSKAKRKGTDAENAVVDYLRSQGWPYTERRAGGGTRDRGDIAGIPGLVVEVKNATRMDLAGWLTEAETERVNDHAAWGVVWAKRRGKSSAGDWYVVMTGDMFTRLLWAAQDLPAPTQEKP